MTTHPRMPAIAMLIFALGIGVAALAATGQFRSAQSSSISELESLIASGKANAETWTAYADALRAHKNFDLAAQAYLKAIQLDPEKKSLRFNQALCLAQANQPDPFFEAINHLTATDPKLAVDVLERPEVSAMRSDARFTPALKSAHSQAAD